MSYQMTVSPDFTPDHISAWFIFNTWLQKALNVSIHLELYDGFDEQRDAISNDQIDLIYANPYDASLLVREKGFLPVARPGKVSDEALIAVREDYPASKVEHLSKGVTIAATDDPDVNLMCGIMLEPVELNHDNTQRLAQKNYPLVAKAVIQRKADLGFFLVEAYDSLSNLTREKLRPLVRSQIHIIHHSLLIGPRLQHMRDSLFAALQNMDQTGKGRVVLESLGLQGWEYINDEEMEFMIDLMDTLNFQPVQD